jgi:biopolymer transport protein ExbD
MAVSAQSPRADQSIAQINITPLVDVLLVLLVIFMVTAPALTATLDLRLPQVRPPDHLAPPPRLTLHVLSSGEFELAGNRMAASQLEVELRAVARTSPDTLLEIEAAADADYQGFARALGAARASGIENIAFPR